MNITSLNTSIYKRAIKMCNQTPVAIKTKNCPPPTLKKDIVSITSNECNNAYKTPDEILSKIITKKQKNGLYLADTNNSSINHCIIPLFNKDCEPVNYFARINKNYCSDEKIEITDKNGKIVGFSNISVKDKDADIYDGKPYLYIDLMLNYQKGKILGLGRALHKLHLIRSNELGLDGRIALQAQKSSIPFHYNSGFRCLSKIDNMSAAECNSLIENTLKTSAGKVDKIDGIDKSIKMYLPLQ